MKSNNKVVLVKEKKPDNKWWITARVFDASHIPVYWKPSFEDICRVMLGIFDCEDCNYPNGKKRYKAIGAFVDFFKKTEGLGWEFLEDRDRWDNFWTEFARKHEIPTSKQ